MNRFQEIRISNKDSAKVNYKNKIKNHFIETKIIFF